jgi:hypothetical protein
VSKAEALEPTLGTITQAAQVMAGQISLDGVATALLNAGLAVSGAPRGIAVLVAAGSLQIDADTLALGPADIARSRPAVVLGQAPPEIWLAAVHERTPQIRFQRDQPTAFAGESRGASRVSALCTPVILREVVSGFLYLEFDGGAEGMTSRRLATMTLLAFQAAMTLEAIRAFETQRHVPLWQTRSQMVGRIATFRWNPGTRLAEGTPEYYAILGLDPTIGPIDFATMTKLVHPADYPLAQASVDDAVRRRAPLRMEWRIIRPTGEVRDLISSGQFNPADPTDPWLQGVVMDITDQKAGDDALRLAQEEAERHVRLAWLGELAGSIIHEVNQPLGAVISSSEAALRWLSRSEPDVAAAVQSIERIRETAKAATRTIAGMRALSSNAPKDPVERSLNAIVSEALQLSGPLLARAHARVEIAYDPDQTIVHCDPGQLIQVVLNLVRNAVDSLREVHDRERLMRVRTLTGDRRRSPSGSSTPSTRPRRTAWALASPSAAGLSWRTTGRSPPGPIPISAQRSSSCCRVLRRRPEYRSPDA